MSGRILILLLISTLLLAACDRQAAERPREGASSGVDRSPVRTGEAPPTLSRPATVGSPTPSPSGIQASAPSPSPSPVPGYVIVATDGAGANLRSGPSTTAPIITTLREGTPVEVLGDPISAEGRSWRRIRSGGREGWVVAVVVRQR